MAKNRFGTKFDRMFVAIATPYKENFRIDEAALRRFLRYYMQPKFVDAGGAIIINPEAGETFYLTRQEKRRNIEIAMEEFLRVNRREELSELVGNYEEFGLSLEELERMRGDS